MKILYLANVYLPGVWAHSLQTMKVCEAMAESGFDVELATGMKKDSDEDIFSYYNIKTRFKITKIFYFDLSKTGKSKLNFLIRSFSFLLFAKLYLVFKKYDILYCRNALAGLFFNNFYLEVHELPPRLKKWQKLAFKKARKIIVLTSFLRKDLVAAGVDSEKIIVAADAVDLREFNLKMAKSEIRQKLNLPLDKKIIAYAGNFYFHDWKGVDIMLESLKYLDNVLCLLIGGQEADIKKLKLQFKTENIIVTGIKPHSEVPKYLIAADVLVLPNKLGDATSQFYTSPLKLFEYMAADRPIVASDLPSLRQVLNEKNAVLVQPNDAQALAQGIKKVLTDNVLAQNLAKQALADVKNYTWQKRVEKIFDFDNIINKQI